MEKKKKSGLAVKIVTPVLIFAICSVITAAAAIKPYNKISMYLDIAFMDSLKTKANDGSISGLHIMENEIDVNYSAATSPEGNVIWPSFAEQYAVLRSDALEVSVPVYWGSNRDILKKGACQASGSSLLGTSGNAVISAHVNTFFANLGKLKIGDEVELSTKYGYFTYEVTELIEFDKNDKKYVIPSSDDRLTLYTCKNDVLGGSEKRFGVICKLKDKQFYAE